MNVADGVKFGVGPVLQGYPSVTDWESGMNMFLVLVCVGCIGLVGLLVAKILMTTKAFQVSRSWGWVVALIPFSEPVFAIKRWDISRVPFFIGLLAVCMLAASAFGVMADDAAYAEFKSVTAGAEDGNRGDVPAGDGPLVAEPKSVDQLVGMSLKDVETLYGSAQGTIDHGGVKVFVYPMFTLESADGKTVSRYQQF